MNYPIFPHSACSSFCLRKAHPIYYLCSLIPNEYCIMQKQERLLNVDWRYKTAFEKTRRENAALLEKVNLQREQIKNLKRKNHPKPWFFERMLKFFTKKRNHQGANANISRPLKNPENRKKLLWMLNLWYSIKYIANNTWWKRKNIVAFIRIHGLKDRVKDWN